METKTDKTVVTEASRHAIIVEDVVKNYVSGELLLQVLKGVNLNIDFGSFVAITGESGSGKSTLLNIIGSLDRLTSGKVIVNNINLADRSENELSDYRNRIIGFVFQFHHLLEDFNALENVMIPYLATKYNPKIAREKAFGLLNSVDLFDRAYHKPSQLSGGEQQRVAIARALINDPEIVLADEPTGNLDEANSQKVLEVLLNLRKERNLTILLITHNAELAAQADKTYKLTKGSLTEV